VTRRRNAQIAGFAFLFYIAVGIVSLVLFPTGGSETAARLATIAERAAAIPLEIALTLLMSVSAVTLGVTLHALTRDVDRELAAFGMAFRVMEGMVAAIAPLFTLSLLYLATSTSDMAETRTVATLLFRADAWKTTVAAILFSFGSLMFCSLLLRGRLIPRLLAWLGVAASVVLVICLPLQLAGLLHRSIATAMWIPMLLFEVPLGILLLIKGAPTTSATPIRT
jgi:hypothetical protein